MASIHKACQALHDPPTFAQVGRTAAKLKLKRIKRSLARDFIRRSRIAVAIRSAPVLFVENLTPTSPYSSSDDNEGSIVVIDSRRSDPDWPWNQAWNDEW